MSDAMDTLKSILGDDAEDKIKDVVGSLSGGNGRNIQSSSLDDMQYLMQMRDIVSKLTQSHNDARSNLLMSLKPYMREGRQKSIETAIKLLTISKLGGIFRL